MFNNYFFKIKNLDYADIDKYKKIFKQLKIDFKVEDNVIYIYLKNKDVINFIYNLLLISVITNINNIKKAELKLNKILFANNYNAAKIIITIFNYIKNYEKTDIKVNNNIIENKQKLNLIDKNCVVDTKNKIIKDNIKNFLITNEKYEKLLELIELVDKKSKNPYLKKFNSIIKNNLKIKQLKEEEKIVEDLF